jgi:hypothetical protein
MDAIAERLDVKLSTWKPEVSREVRAVVSDVIDAADNDALDLLRSRAIEQEVLDQLDESSSR